MAGNRLIFFLNIKKKGIIKIAYKYKPKTKEELVKIVKKEIYEVQGSKDNPNWNADLNCIDTSLITDMSYLFSTKYGLNKFNGNISNWNVSNVTNMSWFNQDISKWDTSNVENMESMFYNSEFNKNINNWNVNNVKDMNHMFVNSKFNKNINKWNINNVKNMYNMFWDSDFNQDIGSWALKKQTKLENISVSLEYNKLPDKIVCSETVANIFICSIDNLDNIFNIDNFKEILRKYLKNRKKLYNSKGYKTKIINKLILNDIADILKHIKDKDMQDKFMKIMAEKNGKEPNININ